MKISGKSLVTLVLSIACSYSGIAFGAAEVIFYRFEIKNALLKDSDTDTPAKKTAAYLKSKNKTHNCIDLRMEGSNSTGNRLDAGTVGLIANTKLKQQDIEAIKKSICEGTVAGCEVNVTMKSFPTDQIRFNGSTPSGRSLPTHMYTKSLPENTQIPTLSKACESGKYSDSWNDAAGFKGAREFLMKLGLDVEKFRTIGISNHQDEEIFILGFPRKTRDSDSSPHSRDAH